jgi:hypothetical protein
MYFTPVDRSMFRAPQNFIRMHSHHWVEVAWRIRTNHADMTHRVCPYCRVGRLLAEFRNIIAGTWTAAKTSGAAGPVYRIANASSM